MIIKYGVSLGKMREICAFWKQLYLYACLDTNGLGLEDAFGLDHFENQVNADWWRLRLKLGRN